MKAILLLLISTQVFAKLPSSQKILELPEIDIEQELSKDSQNTRKDQPLQYATATDMEPITVKNGVNSHGQWHVSADGSWIWRLSVRAENAKSLEFGFHDFFLPPTAQLSFFDWSQDLAKGPFRDDMNKTHQQLWTGPIIGDQVTIELKVSDHYKPFVSFSIKNVNRGYRSIWQDVDLLPKMGQQRFWDNTNEETDKSGSCNVDVTCNEGDDWQDQINSVGRYTITRNGGSFLCTGQMINNTANNGRALFLTANHCGFDSSNDSTINLWWNYQSNQCRAPGSGASGNPIPISGFNDTQSGSTFLASYAPSDFALLELDQRPDAEYDVFYTGWDRRGVGLNSAVSIHHPSGHAKRISFENDSTSISSYLGNTGSGTTHIRVADWDIGTTEGGSSGSGLWGANKLLVGQLHGGFAACGNDDPDWYGRLSVSWEGGGTSNSRLKDWLDPINSGAQTLPGLGGCSAVNVSINHQHNNPTVGSVQNYRAIVDGGVGPYRYQWNVNGDQYPDGEQPTITAVYNQQYTGNINVTVTDSEGCVGTATAAVVIQAPEITLRNAGTATQMCGNNDNFVDPGEKWRVPVTLQNNGFADAQNAYAVFTKSTSAPGTMITAQDDFGNGVSACDRQFIDISSTGTALTLVDANPNDAFDANDEGVASVNLPISFDLYGNNINALYLSSNGYISTNPDESGFDFDNDCPLPSLPNNGNNGSTTSARIIPMHDDLITQNIYYQHFNSCPRASELGANLPCDVFMYHDVDRYENPNITIDHFNFEAILYPTVNQWVYQYDGVGFNPASSSVGLQNNNATDGVSFACNTANSFDTESAVCVYHANNQPTQDSNFLHLETPAVALNNLQVGQQHQANIEFSVAQNATCDSPIAINMQAAVGETGFNQNNSVILSTRLGNNGACNVVTNCPLNNDNDITTTNGLWYNQNRPGNGYDMYYSENGLLYIHYTALPNHASVWYISDIEQLSNNQVYNNVNKISYNGPFQGSTQQTTTVGESVTTLINSNLAIQTRTIDGQFSADLLQPFMFSNTPTEQRTGLWFNPNEPGWGASVGTQGDTEIVINYIYDNSGQPYWVIGNGANQAVADIDMNYSVTFCPHCPITPVLSSSVGTTRIDYNQSNTTGTMENMQINVNNGLNNGQWIRNNIPFNLLTAPLDN